MTHPQGRDLEPTLLRLTNEFAEDDRTRIAAALLQRLMKPGETMITRQVYMHLHETSDFPVTVAVATDRDARRRLLEIGGLFETFGLLGDDADLAPAAPPTPDAVPTPAAPCDHKYVRVTTVLADRVEIDDRCLLCHAERPRGAVGGE